MRTLDSLHRALAAVTSAPAASVERIAALDALCALGESTLHTEVTQARAAGATWAAIGRGLGVTRQAAFQRFGAKTRETTKGEAMPQTLLTKTPEQARDVLVAIMESRAADAISAYFGEEAAAVLTAEKLTSVWGDLRASFGEWHEFTGMTAMLSGEYVVVESRLEFEAGAVVCRSTWDSNGKLAGLFFFPVPE